MHFAFAETTSTSGATFTWLYNAILKLLPPVVVPRMVRFRTTHVRLSYPLFAHGEQNVLPPSFVMVASLSPPFFLLNNRCYKSLPTERTATRARVFNAWNACAKLHCAVDRAGGSGKTHHHNHAFNRVFNRSSEENGRSLTRWHYFKKWRKLIATERYVLAGRGKIVSIWTEDCFHIWGFAVCFGS